MVPLSSYWTVSAGPIRPEQAIVLCPPAGTLVRIESREDDIQSDVAKIIGKSRSHVANTLRLLNLPEAAKALVRDGAIWDEATIYAAVNVLQPMLQLAIADNPAFGISRVDIDRPGPHGTRAPLFEFRYCFFAFLGGGHRCARRS